MIVDFLRFRGRPGRTLPDVLDEHRGQLFMLSGDEATTNDELYFGRDAAGTRELVKLAVQGDPITGLETAGSTPAIANVAAGSTATISIAGNDTAGRISIQPGGAGIGAGNLVTITFATPRPDANYEVLLQPFNDNAANISGPVARPASLSATTWSLNRATTPLTSGTTYLWSYLVAER